MCHTMLIDAFDSDARWQLLMRSSNNKDEGNSLFKTCYIITIKASILAWCLQKELTRFCTTTWFRRFCSMVFVWVFMVWTSLISGKTLYSRARASERFELLLLSGVCSLCRSEKQHKPHEGLRRQNIVIKDFEMYDSEQCTTEDYLCF